ncbi:MAG: HAD hydrolase-like protein [Ruminococcus sp.]|nr:HAD hydrolase-like protein [Ruminococcus sp.]
MNKEVRTVAFDLGGVLAYQDLFILTEEELFLLKIFMNRNKCVNRELLEYAKSKIEEIYLKIHKLNNTAISTLEMLHQDGIRPSIWTNNIKEINAWFEEVGIYKYIRREDIINSIYLGVDKPNINFYYKALTLLKNNPREVLFLDDNYQNVLNAIKCGIIGKEYNMKDSLEETVKREIKRSRLQ